MSLAVHISATSSPTSFAANNARYPLGANDEPAGSARRRGGRNGAGAVGTSSSVVGEDDDRKLRGSRRARGDDGSGGGGGSMHWLFYFSVVLLMFVGVLMVAHAIHVLVAYRSHGVASHGGGGGGISHLNKNGGGAGGGAHFKPGTQIWIDPQSLGRHPGPYGTPVSVAPDPRVAENAKRFPLREAAHVDPTFISVIVPLRAAQMPSLFLRRLAVTRVARLEVILVAIDRFTPDAFSQGLHSLSSAPLVDQVDANLHIDMHWRGSRVESVLHPAFMSAKLIRVAKNSPADGGVYPGLSELIMIGADASDGEAGLLFFAEPTHLPHHPFLLDELLEALHDAERHTAHPTHRSAVAVQCTAMLEANRHDQAEDGALVALDHGYAIDIGSARSQPAVFLSRRVAGFGARDARLHSLDLVDAVAPHCLLVKKRQLYLAGGLTSAGPSSLDLAVSGKLDGQAIENSLELLRVRILRVEKTMESISLAEVHSAGNGLRQLVREAYAEVVDASALWEELTGKVFDSELSKKASPLAEDADNKAAAQVKKEPIEIRLKFHTRNLGDQVTATRKLGRTRDSSHVEEQVGWELSLRLRDAGYSVWASNVTVILRDDLLPAEVQGALSVTKSTQNQASFPMTGDFSNRWSNYARALHPAFNSSREPVVRVVWYSICCGCCGFSSEIVHFVTPLQRRYYVSVLLGPKCFCEGYPSSVSDGLTRMHITGEQYVLQRTSRDEIMVWISHTDPLSFNNDVFNRRRPDYVVGRSMYEFSRIGANWVASCNKHADEIWVPAQFVYDIFASSGVEPSKLVIIPEGVDTDFYSPTAHVRLALPLDELHQGKWVHYCNSPAPADAYKFFSNFKWEPRKGWDILFEAYELQFGNSARARAWRHETAPLQGPGKRSLPFERPVSLYILSYLFLIGGGNTHNVSRVVHDLEEWIKVQFPDLSGPHQLPHFCVITDSVTEVELAQMYNAMDAFVLPTRGEGWGLPTIQSMAMGKPVISTNFGGQLEFMTRENSFLIELEGVEEIPADSVYGFQDGKKWGTPSVNHTAQLMRYVLDHPDHATAVGRRAREHVVQHFSEEAVADVVDARLQAIRGIVLDRRSAAVGGPAEG